MVFTRKQSILRREMYNLSATASYLKYVRYIKIKDKYILTIKERNLVSKRNYKVKDSFRSYFLKIYYHSDINRRIIKDTFREGINAGKYLAYTNIEMLLLIKNRSILPPELIYKIAGYL